ncbi:sigma 54-interacting transcriptional regulator [Fusibacter ferrireducens]|uniref:Sigma 54-interacting transcriptional regulator n=1 Tax=Fusibacter ferrireducens TaxID=2785058 RepID=A0ABR9ZQU8_9FIRM|nr:sigma 54-interacting transcriptional regulator [Fusibacter ferrireducens]MBF4692523.1 sigma 54-interacting transcriptional regulator [Fusibacter ferrireducens]
MKAQEELYQKLLSLLDQYNHLGGITASELAEHVSLKRSVVSLYLNQLCEQGRLQKTLMRPVRFNRIQFIPSKDVFKRFIGYSGSHLNQISQCKSAVMYPPDGLPIIITGDSGVGKSYLASLIYEYALSKEVIPPEAPYVELNCADYANNPELLSSMLFGHTEGAFTGATKNKKGLLDAANGGYLFLDEIHRLSSENQEKLFLFMDKGKFRRLGENDHWHSSHVRFIFATTEDTNTHLIGTFLRRIPIRIHLLNYKSRPIMEKLDLIESLYQNEAIQIQKNLLVHEQLINKLLSMEATGNIGTLNNAIKISIANAYNNQSTTEQLILTKEHLVYETNEIKSSELIQTPTHFFGIAFRSHTEKQISTQLYHEFKDKIWTIANHTDFFEADPIAMIKQIIDEIDRFMTNFSFYTQEVDKNYLKLNEQKLLSKIDTCIHLVQTTYGIELHTSIIELLKKICIYIISHDGQLTFSESLLAKIVYANNTQFRISEKISASILENTSVDSNTLFALIYYILEPQNFSVNTIEGIIIAHGESTATSIASVANVLCKDYIFEPFDMPINISNAEIIKQVNAYLKNIDTRKGVILLVDMGSLQTLYEPIKNHLNGELLIVNNLSTLMAIDIGLKIQTHIPFQQIIETTQNAYISETKFYEGLTLGNNVIISCISGIGIAQKIKSIFDGVLLPNQLDILTIEYQELKRLIQSSSKTQLNHTQLIITTTPISTHPIPSVNIENILNMSEVNIFRVALKQILSAAQLDQITENIIKLFSIEGIKDHLSFLNPNVIISEVSEVIKKYEDYYQVSFEHHIRLNLLMHISIMVERLILHELKDIEDDYKPSSAQNKFVHLSKRAFNTIEKKYHFTVPKSELLLIFEILEDSLTYAN